MTLSNIKIDCNASAQNLELFDRLASIGDFSMQIDDITGITMEYVGPDISAWEKEVHLAKVEACLLDFGFVDKSESVEGTLRFAQPQDAQVAVAKNTKEYESTEEDRVDQETVGEGTPNGGDRITKAGRIREQSQIVQLHLSDEEERISRGFEYFGENLPRGSYVRGARR